MNLGKALTIHKCFPLLHYWNHGCTKGCSPVPRALLEWAFSVINASRRCCFICFRGLQSRQTGCAMPQLWSLIKTGCCTSIMLLFQVSEGSRTQLCFLFSHRCVFLHFFFLSTFGSLKNKMKSVWSVCRLVWQIRFFFLSCSERRGYYWGSLIGHWISPLSVPGLWILDYWLLYWWA